MKDGISRPKLNLFQELSPLEAIIRTTMHEGDKDLFDIFADKQTIPNLLVALGAPTIIPTDIWSPTGIEHMLKIGHKLYEDSRKELLRKRKNKNKKERKKTLVEESETEEVVEPESIPSVEPSIIDEDEDIETITLENVLKEYNIGYNKITVTLGEEKTGKIENDILMRSKESRMTVYDTLESILTVFLDEEGDDLKQAIIKTDTYTIAIWRQGGVFYLFDPKGRDSEGMTIGRDGWSSKVYPPEEVGEQEQETVKMVEGKSLLTYLLNPMSLIHFGVSRV